MVDFGDFRVSRRNRRRTRRHDGLPACQTEASPEAARRFARHKLGRVGVGSTSSTRVSGMAGFGASRPLPSVPTNVRLLNRLPTLDLGGGD